MAPAALKWIGTRRLVARVLVVTALELVVPELVPRVIRKLVFRDETRDFFFVAFVGLCVPL